MSSDQPPMAVKPCTDVQVNGITIVYIFILKLMEFIAQHFSDSFIHCVKLQSIWNQIRGTLRNATVYVTSHAGQFDEARS